VKAHCFCWALACKPFHACCRCGLLLLKNDVTRRLARKPCPGRED
jgi:hypothetical protein